MITKPIRAFAILLPVMFMLAGCESATTPVPSVQGTDLPRETVPSTASASPEAPLDITLLRMRYVFAIGPQEPLQGTLELEGTCVVLDGAAAVFPNVAHVEAPDRLVTQGATLRIGADIEDVLAWGLVPIEGSRLAATDTRIDDEGIVGLEDCPPSSFEEYVILGNVDPTE